MNKDINKKKKSEEQRLNSLKLKQDEYRTKKTIITNEVNNTRLVFYCVNWF